jgi:hypothetical protein
MLGLYYSNERETMRDYFDEFYDEYYATQKAPSVDSCYCTNSMICSICVKGYN